MSEDTYADGSPAYRPKHDGEIKTHVRSTTVSVFGRSYCYITCPFCGYDCKAYIWSLAGGGKRCPECKAIHTSMGFSVKRSKNETTYR